MKRSGPLRDRLALRALRLSAVAWGAAERVGLDLAGAVEGPPLLADAARAAAFDGLLARGGTVTAADCPLRCASC